MKLTHRASSAIALAAALISTGCETAPVAGPTPEVGDVRYAVVSNPRATFTYFDQGSEQRLINDTVTTSGFITGDKRSATGHNLAGSSVYDDGLCGVEAQVFAGGSGDATLDPIGVRRMSGCNSSIKRALTLDYGTPIVGVGGPQITAAHFTNVREVEDLPYNGTAGNVGFRRFRLQPRGTTKCDWVRYGTTVNGEHVDFTATINEQTVISKPMRLEAIAPNTWIATSQPNENGQHVAVCEEAAGKGVSFTAAYDIPFRIQVVMR